MVMGAAPTEDDGKVMVIISYENESGDVFTEEKELTLFVTEDMSDMGEMEAWNPEDELPKEKGGFPSELLNQQKLLPAALAIIVILAAVIVVMAVKRRREKAALEADEDEDEEE